jgi:probable phosphoglycerate mutase
VHHQLRIRLNAKRAQQILLLRHGDIQIAAHQKHFIGQTDLPLNERGRSQARFWRQSLSGIRIEHIYTSDLTRCLQTARIIATDHSVDINPSAALREIRLGQWDGLSFAQVRRQWPEMFRQRGRSIVRFRPPGGENYADLQRRVIPALDDMLGHSDGTILIVAHAGVNRVILCHLLGMPLENLFRISQGRGGLNLIERRAAGFRIRALNLLPDHEDCKPATP